MEEIDIPNDSLTISSLSQSPWGGKSRVFGRTEHLGQNKENTHEGTLGKSELERTYNDTNKTSTVKSLSITGDKNEINYMDEHS